MDCESSLVTVDPDGSANAQGVPTQVSVKPSAVRKQHCLVVFLTSKMTQPFVV